MVPESSQHRNASQTASTSRQGESIALWLHTETPTWPGTGGVQWRKVQIVTETRPERRERKEQKGHLRLGNKFKVNNRQTAKCQQYWRVAPWSGQLYKWTSPWSDWRKLRPSVHWPLAHYTALAIIMAPWPLAQNNICHWFEIFIKMTTLSNNQLNGLDGHLSLKSLGTWCLAHCWPSLPFVSAEK